MKALLSELTDRSYKSPPAQVALKTIIAARDAGLVEVYPETRRTHHPRCKLTREGKRLQTAMKHPIHPP